jgi:hypothetical protein
MIENLRKEHDKSLKTVEDLRSNNSDLAKSLSAKDRRVQDLEKVLAEQKESSRKKVSYLLDKLKLLFEEYEKSLNEFGVRPAPLPTDLGVSGFMEWIEAEFKALPEVISGANDFVAAFSIESILKLLHNFDRADLATFREKLSQFPDALSTSRIRPNDDVQVIKSRFAREFWIASAKEAVKSITRAKLAHVSFRTISFAAGNSRIFCFSDFYCLCFSMAFLVDR